MIRFISDLHLGHKNILNFCPNRGGTDVQSHNEWLVHQWNSVVEKRDHIYVLGDICFHGDDLKYLRQMRGQKTMIWGNHDKFSLPTYQEYFHQVKGFMKKHGFWISHSPIHPRELRGKKNIHGHVHQHHILTADGDIDPNYINVCVDALDGKPISLEELSRIK